MGSTSTSGRSLSFVFFVFLLTAGCHGYAELVHSAWALAGNRSASWYSVRVTPVEGVNLNADNFGSTYHPLGAVSCTQSDVLGITLPSFMLPVPSTNSSTFSVVLAINGSIASGLTGSNNVLLNLQGLNVSFSTGVLPGGILFTLSTSSLDPTASFSIPSHTLQSGNSPLFISLSRRTDGALRLCSGNTPAPLLTSVLDPRDLASQNVSDGWTTIPFLSEWTPLQNITQDLLIGDRFGGGATLKLLGLWLLLEEGDTSSSMTCSTILSTFTSLLLPQPPPPTTADKNSLPSSAHSSLQMQPLTTPSLSTQLLQYSNSPPVLESSVMMPLDGQPLLSDPVFFTASVMDLDGDAVRARITCFGASDFQCRTASCGPYMVSGLGVPGQVLAITAFPVYTRAGRYIIRLEATDGRGGLLSQDHIVLVRKDNDTARAAPCCRYAATVITAQQGRPIHNKVYRDPSLYEYASSLGWPSGGYMDEEDLEAERLFDYGILAPLPWSDIGSSLSYVSCADVYIGGAGGLSVMGIGSQKQFSLNHGLNKRILVLPQGFSWANQVPSSQQPVCQEHWSEWALDSPVTGAVSRNSSGQVLEYCSFACIPEGVSSMINVTGAFDRWMEQIIETTYGQVSFSPDVDVTPTLWMPFANPSGSPFLYSDQPTHPYLSNLGINEETDYRIIMVLSPLPRQANPEGYTAWSSAPTFMFVMMCNPMHYYLVHETGHLFGLPHATMYKLDNATSLPTDPLGPGVIEDSYTDKLDTMACCRGDYNVFFRLFAGWIPATERYDMSFLPSLNASTVNISSTLTASTTNTPAISGITLAAPLNSEGSLQVEGIPGRTSTSSNSSVLQNDTLSGSVIGVSEGSLFLNASQISEYSPPSKSSTNSTVVQQDLVLWPFDRGESRGKLKAVVIRLSIDEMLVLSFRSMAFWQDVRLGAEGYSSTTDRTLGPDQMRDNMAGLSVESSLLLCNNLKLRTAQWTTRGMLDFNLVFPLWPSAFPASPGAYAPDPPRAAYANLKEGFSWTDAKRGFGVLVKRIAECDSEAEIPVYNYTVPAFYGFRGEYPGLQAFDRSDFSGYNQFNCLHVTVSSGVTTIPGSLDIRVAVGGGDLAVTPEYQLDLQGAAGFPLTPNIQLTWPGGNLGDLTSVVWKDATNRTFAYDTTNVTLPPPLNPLMESSATGAPSCIGNQCPSTSTYWLKAAAADGSQTLVKMQLVEVSLDHFLIEMSYTYFLTDRVMTGEEAHYVPVLRSGPVSPHQPQGITLNLQATASVSSSNPTTQTQQQTASVFLGTSYTDFQVTQMLDCDVSRQWTLTLLLILPSAGSFISGPSLPLAVFSQSANIGLGVTQAIPGLWLVLPALSRTVSGLVLRVGWQGYTQDLDISIAAQSSLGGELQVVVVRDGERLGVWANGLGGWLLLNLTCVPTRNNTRACNHEPTSSDPPLNPVLRLLGPPLGTSNAATPPPPILVTTARLYNYVIPQYNLASEMTCVQSKSCGFFFLSGWVPTPYGPQQVVRPLPGTITLMSGKVTPGVMQSTYNVSSGGYIYIVDVGPWQVCSASCGGGRRVREVVCLMISPQGSTQIVSLDQCPVANLPAASEPCNMLQCPSAYMVLQQPVAAACLGPLLCPAAQSTWISSKSNAPMTLICKSSFGLYLPLSSCTNASVAAMSSGQSSAPTTIFSVHTPFSPSSHEPWSQVLLELPKQLDSIIVDVVPVSQTVSLQTAITSFNGSLLQSPCTVSGNIFTSQSSTASSSASSSSSSSVWSSCNGSSSSSSIDNAPNWALGTWSECTATCGGGTRSRSVYCILGWISGSLAATHSVLSSSTCTAIYGEIPSTLLLQSCNTAPCSKYAWKVGPWGQCQGEAPAGYAQRLVQCVVYSTAGITNRTTLLAAPQMCGGSTTPLSPGIAGSSTNLSDAELSSMAVLGFAPSGFITPEDASPCPKSPEGAALCRLPGMSNQASCSGQGACTYTGCLCLNSYQGQFCEVPPTCLTGIVDKSGSCCSSLTIDVNGTCCHPGSLLDSAGLCCKAGVQLDACGVCGGSSASVDMKGVCCSGLVDQAGSCCTSGFIDECGVCDGDSTSCLLAVAFQVSIPSAGNSNVTTSLSLGPALWNSTMMWLEGSIQTACTAVSMTCSVTLTEVTEGGIASNDQAASNATDDPAATRLVIALISNRLLGAAAPININSTGMQVDTVVIKAGDAPTSGSGFYSGSFHFTIAGLMPYVVETIATSSSSVSSASNTQPSSFVQDSLLLTAVIMVDRFGVCGNGLCEVGEQVWTDSSNASGSSMIQASPCPQDCPYTFHTCPSPASTAIGNASLECGGNGVCLRASGSCACYDGYYGDDCGACEPSYWPNNVGACVRQYINGLTIFQLLEPASVDQSPINASSTSSQLSDTTLIAVVTSVSVGSVISFTLLFVFLFSKARKQQQKVASVVDLVKDSWVPMKLIHVSRPTPLTPSHSIKRSPLSLPVVSGPFSSRNTGVSTEADVSSAYSSSIPSSPVRFRSKQLTNETSPAVKKKEHNATCSRSQQLSSNPYSSEHEPAAVSPHLRLERVHSKSRFNLMYKSPSNCSTSSGTNESAVSTVTISLRKKRLEDLLPDLDLLPDVEIGKSRAGQSAHPDHITLSILPKVSSQEPEAWQPARCSRNRDRQATRDQTGSKKLSSSAVVAAVATAPAAAAGSTAECVKDCRASMPCLASSITYNASDVAGSFSLLPYAASSMDHYNASSMDHYIQNHPASAVLVACRTGHEHDNEENAISLPLSTHHVPSLPGMINNGGEGGLNNLADHEPERSESSRFAWARLLQGGVKDNRGCGDAM
ncbi:hypothetical protein CEUSTIGMA_g12491.t1 [Chlamydomonas eustigma]|uniref:EGF-like domain-containing protein n=1 Tax=Chlamydomonas eustigma TaxID=1157962 RepID=A0A250XPR7_9CHLO|nr:hypothetical protein CEUSTIGMA_g12491.t1 [Chlamydomonas eustigma]|eukprot:GAX85071.1 hypothetical protein CEUSTIGMA_g12491.t1 [Chlamydomonas eustigma]